MVVGGHFCPRPCQLRAVCSRGPPGSRGLALPHCLRRERSSPSGWGQVPSRRPSTHKSGADQRPLQAHAGRWPSGWHRLGDRGYFGAPMGFVKDHDLFRAGVDHGALAVDHDFRAGLKARVAAGRARVGVCGPRAFASLEGGAWCPAPSPPPGEAERSRVPADRGPPAAQRPSAMIGRGPGYTRSWSAGLVDQRRSTAEKPQTPTAKAPKIGTSHDERKCTRTIVTDS